MAPRKRRKIFLGHPPTHKSYRPYVTALGQAAISWNALQDACAWLLGEMFTENVDLPEIAAMWNSLRSDRNQRGLLKAVIDYEHATGEINEDLYVRVEWLLKEANKVSVVRDAIIHVPLTSDDKHGVRIDDTMGGHAAAALTNRDLLTELRWCRDAALTLADFAFRLIYWMGAFGRPLPEIPRMPNRGQKNARPNRPRQHNRK